MLQKTSMQKLIGISVGVVLCAIVLAFAVINAIKWVMSPKEEDTVQTPAEEAANVESDVIFHNGAPTGLWFQMDGSLLIADSYNKVVWSLRIGEQPEIYTGSIMISDAAGIPIGGYSDTTLADSAYLLPWGLAGFSDGYILSDTDNNVIRFFDLENVRTAAGSGEAGYRDGHSTSAEFDRPSAVAVDDRGNVYIADTGNHLIRQIDKDGNVSTYAGSTEGCADGALTDAAFRSPMGLYWRGGALYVADSGNHRICKIAGGVVSVVAGPHENPPTPQETFEHGGYVDGDAAQAMFSNPKGVAVSASGDIYVADTGNHAIRKISAGQVSTLHIIDTDASEVYPISPVCIAIEGNALYVADEFAGVVFRQPMN